MNGIIDQQTPVWSPPAQRTMLHENLQLQSSPNTIGFIKDLADLERQMNEHGKEFDAAIETLRAMYMFSDHDEIDRYLRSNRTVAPVLIEAFPYMVRAFNGSPMLLDVTNDEGPAETINALALWWGRREEARSALQSFDDLWWLDNIRKGGGKIVFDYQIEK